MSKRKKRHVSTRPGNKVRITTRSGRNFSGQFEEAHDKYVMVSGQRIEVGDIDQFIVERKSKFMNTSRVSRGLRRERRRKTYTGPYTCNVCGLLEQSLPAMLLHHDKHRAPGDMPLVDSGVVVSKMDEKKEDVTVSDATKVTEVRSGAPVTIRGESVRLVWEAFKQGKPFAHTAKLHSLPYWSVYGWYRAFRGLDKYKSDRRNATPQDVLLEVDAYVSKLGPAPAKKRRTRRVAPRVRTVRPTNPDGPALTQSENVSKHETVQFSAALSTAGLTLGLGRPTDPDGLWDYWSALAHYASKIAKEVYLAGTELEEMLGPTHQKHLYEQYLSWKDRAIAAEGKLAAISAAMKEDKGD